MSAAQVPKIAVLVSGSGTNLQAMLDAIQAGTLNAEICAVLSDKPAAKGLERARQQSIPTIAIDFRQFAERSAFDTELDAALTDIQADFIALAGYMRILSAATVLRQHGRMVNIHPSLLPTYPGLRTYKRALADGAAWHGTTVHFVIPKLDAGPAIVQYRVAVRPDETEHSLQARVQTGEYQIYPQALDWLATGRLALAGDAVMFDGVPLSEPLVVNEASA
jgi:phosphoribosylglycinamide formyltransferase-1